MPDVAFTRKTHSSGSVPPENRPEQSGMEAISYLITNIYVIALAFPTFVD
jgi:hypothetical protein